MGLWRLSVSSTVCLEKGEFLVLKIETKYRGVS